MSAKSPAGAARATPARAVDAVGAPASHWAADLADQALERARVRGEQEAAVSAADAALAAVLRSSGLAYVDRLEAALASIADVVNARVGRRLLRTGRTFTGSVSLRADTGAYVACALMRLVQPDAAQPVDVEVVVQPDADPGWRTMTPYAVTVQDGALVIDGHGPEALAAFVTAPFLRTLRLGGR